ncbi:MAG: ABC transporter permease [Bacteroidetes bacterium]|nr:ABC transporter permease [Bacteroidota bacterium]
MIKRSSPGFARWLLARFLLREEFHEKLGDLEECFMVEVEKSGPIRAYFWYWGEVIISIPLLIKETIYGEGIMLRNYLKSTLRNIMNYKGYSFINIFGLAAGLACCILILLWVQHELSFDNFHENGERLYRITVERNGDTFSSNPWALIPTLKNNYPEIECGTSFTYARLLTKYNDNDFYAECRMVFPDFFDMFTYKFINGNPRSAFSHLNDVVITEEMALKYFGSANPIGKIIQLDNTTDLKVTAVIENNPSNSHLKFDILFHPALYMGEKRLTTWSMDGPGYLMLRENVDVDEVRDKIRNTINDIDTRTNNKWYVGLQPLRDINLHALNGTDPILYIYVFSSIAFAVLLIACINFVNLSTARSTRRAKEVALRKVAGAERKELVKQFIGETVLLTFIAMLLALLMSSLMLPYFNNLASRELSLNLIDNWILTTGLILITLLTGILSGIYPSLVISSFQPASIFRNSFVKSGGHRLRKVLLVIQFTATITLIISTLIISNQIRFIRNSNLGFDRDQIIVIPTNNGLRQKYDTLKKRLLSESGIINVTAASQAPLEISATNPVYWEGRSSNDYEMMNFVCLDYDYFETFGMDMKYGRTFSREFGADSMNYIINEAALKLTNYKEQPVGRMFSMWRDEGEIVGVVKDFHGTSLHNEIRPIVFMLYQNLPYFNMFVKVSPQNLTATIENIESVIKDVVPEFKFEYTFMDDDFNEQYQDEMRIANIFESFSTLAIIISCLGLIGMVSYMAERKTKEIAIRKIVGASHSVILSLISKEFITLALLANLIAWPLAYYLMNQWIASFAYSNPIGIWVFIFSGLAVVIQTLITISYQAIKAASAKPVEILKAE